MGKNSSQRGLDASKGLDTMKPLLTRKLTLAEFEFCEHLRLDKGIDIDDKLSQTLHLCWPFASNIGALCKSPRLWGHMNLSEDSEISCESCLERLAELKTVLHEFEIEKDLVISHGRLSKEIDRFYKLELAINDYFWALDNPEKAKLLPDLGNPLDTFRKVYQEHLQANVISNGHQQ